MKKIYLLILLFSALFFSNSSYATMDTIRVSNFQFTPASLNVNVGDTILWIWVSGAHTTTSTTIPPGAAPWDNLITTSISSFAYPVTVAGNYSYMCTPHGFTGQFTAINTNINSPAPQPGFSIFSNRHLAYTIAYSLTHSSNVKISVYDITGKSVRLLESSFQPAGDHLNTYYLEDLLKGIYIIEMQTDSQRFNKRIVID